MKTLLVCGRFQPFHNGHLSFLEKASNIHEGPILIGVIINSRLDGTKDSDNPLGSVSQRAHSKTNNPFSLIERLKVVNEVVANTSLTSRCTVTAFPRPELYWNLVCDICSENRIWALPEKLDEFDKRKRTYFQNKGDEVLLIPGKKNISGTQIRQLARHEPARLKSLLPPPSLKLIEKKFKYKEK